MHPSAMNNSDLFFSRYSDYFKKKNGNIHVVEIGSQNVNGTIRDKCPNEFKYTGLDFVEGQGVDIVLDDPYHLPFENESIDILVTSSCFEHSEMFWMVFLEAIRVLKSDGLLYLNAPSNGVVHAYPVDCWRFYPDSGKALEKWANKNGYSVQLLESYISHQDVTPLITTQWNDFVAIFVKNSLHSNDHAHRILDAYENYTNGWVRNCLTLQKANSACEDQRKLLAISRIINNEIDASTVITNDDQLTIQEKKLAVISKILSNEIRCL